MSQIRAKNMEKTHFVDFFQRIPYFQTPLILLLQRQDDARLYSIFRVSAKATLNLRHWELLT